MCADKVDSNITGLSYAVETSLKTIAGSPVFYGLEPNSYSDFGGEVSTVARAPLDPSRQNKKGTITDFDANGGFNHDFVLDTNFTRLLQGFMFAAIREKPTTKPLNGTLNVVTSVTASDDKFNLTSTGAAFNIAGLLVKATGFTNNANNGIHVVTSADTDDITVASSLTDETPPNTAYVEAVGYEFDTAEAAIVKTGNLLSLTDSGNGLASLGLNVGEWIYIGGDASANGDSFANNKGFARIKTIAAGAITFDLATFAGASESSTSKKIRIFFGNIIKNEKLPTNIVRYTYHLQRTLGVGATATQAEYLEGAVANEFTLNVPGQDKINADLSFVACDSSFRSGDGADTIKSAAGSLVSAAGAQAFNTSSDVVFNRLYVHDATTSSPSALFAYVSEANIGINNGVTPNKAVGVAGAFDLSAGNFNVSGSVTAYFSTVAAAQAVRNNADVGYAFIACAANKGFAFDIPLLGLGGGKPNVEKDTPIMVPLESNGAECAAGYTLLYNEFPYLPDVAMPG